MARAQFPLWFAYSRFTDAEVEARVRDSCTQRGVTFVSITKHYAVDDPSPLRAQGRHYLITYDTPDERVVDHDAVMLDAKPEIDRRRAGAR